MMSSEDKTIAIIGGSGILALGLILSSAFFGVTAREKSEERKYNTCIEAGKIWVDENCIGGSSDASINKATVSGVTWRYALKPHFNNRYKNKKINGCWVIPRNDGSCFWVPKMPDETW